MVLNLPARAHLKVVGDLFTWCQVLLLFFLPLGNGLSVGGSRELEAHGAGRATLRECSVLSRPTPVGRFSAPFCSAFSWWEGSRLAVPPPGLSTPAVLCLSAPFLLSWATAPSSRLCFLQCHVVDPGGCSRYPIKQGHRGHPSRHYLP